MVVSEIRSLYRDENDLLRTVIKRIYEERDATLDRWTVKKVEYRFDDPPVPSDAIEVSLEHRHGWLVPPAWEFRDRGVGIPAEAGVAVSSNQ